jgi:hypothetical protein
MSIRENNRGIFGKMKLVGKRFLKGMILPAAIFGTVGLFIPGAVTGKLLISALIKGGILSVGFGFLNDAAWKLYDRMLENQAAYTFA